MTNSLRFCSICGEGTVTEKQFTESFSYKGKTRNLILICAECNACGSEFADDALSKRNQKTIRSATKEIDGLLTSTEVRMLRKKWSITQAQAGKIFGGGPVAFAKYEADDIIQSEAMDNLLRVAEAVPEARRWLFEKAYIQTPLQMSARASIGIISSKPTKSHYNRKFEHQVSALHAGYISAASETIVDAPSAEQLVMVTAAVLPIEHFEPVKNFPQVRLYGKEENQTYLHRPNYSEQDYDRHRI
ncbi:type II toxin-antitoxin system MqsA family antitoxin [Pseudomonas sp. SWRI50]|uniref:type II toxin-antitoxin system MqsA family antitoxin n=1 Tax=Pseudomonas sp. SWRI50 TaxID=2745484 RepID=UPI001644F4A9|nr:type II toxin-antitoxin system MqsA family antitoxin [Pseudomonas sp. SWRI50]MBC3484706.1 type II toxin-antitoxin system MqsA family antitoxin [Pseudomonas sp. SWRI50]